jgi:hypothetical protein
VSMAASTPMRAMRAPRFAGPPPRAP